MTRANTNNHMARLDTLAGMLKSDDFLTANDLAHELNISVRTLYRDISLLRDRGLPIDADKGRGGGIRLHRNWGLGKLSLTDQEAIDMLISISIAEKMKSPLFMAGLKSIRHKLMALFSPSQKLKVTQMRKRIRIGQTTSPHILASYDLADSQRAHDLNRAFIFKECLNISYRDVKKQLTHRQIEPQYLYLNYPIWYVLAWDKLKEDYRTFRYDRIEKASCTGEEFRLKPYADFAHMVEGDAATTP